MGRLHLRSASRGHPLEWLAYQFLKSYDSLQLRSCAATWFPQVVLPAAGRPEHSADFGWFDRLHEKNTNQCHALGSPRLQPMCPRTGHAGVKMVNTCLDYGHHMCTTCSQHVRHMLTADRRHGHNMFTTGSEPAYNMFAPLSAAL